MFKAKVDTFEEIVKSMEIGKHKTQNLCQENIKLAVKLRDFNNKIRVLQEKLKESRVNHNTILKNINDNLKPKYQTGRKSISNNILESWNSNVTYIVQEDSQKLSKQEDDTKKNYQGKTQVKQSRKIR